jgi:DNA-binding PadR family transcriptional regulator
MRDGASMTLPPGAITPTMFQILLSLRDGERHGYSMMRDIGRQTDGAMQVGAATLYRSIKKLVDAGLIEETDERPDPELDDERRRYYRLTALGERVAKEEAERLAKLVEAAYHKRLLGRGRFAHLGGKP